MEWLRVHVLRDFSAILTRDAEGNAKTTTIVIWLWLVSAINASTLAQERVVLKRYVQS